MEEVDNMKIEDVMRHKRAICFAGGGILGIGHAGALDKLFELGYLDNITHTTGTSVGSIMSAAIACKATRNYVKNTLFGMNTRAFRDGGCCLANLWRFLRKGGLYKGDAILDFAKKLMKDLTGDENTTF